MDPRKVPADGVPAICSACQRVFPVMPAPGHESREPGPPESARPDPAEAPPVEAPPATDADEKRESSAPPPGGDDWSPFEDLSSLATDVARSGEEGTPEVEPETAQSSLSKGMARFGRRDVKERARHLARVLVSDIIAYHPARYQESLQRGTLKEDFEAEVQKSWKEYVDQVGPQMAESTPYFNEALNEVLAKGKEVF